MSMGKGQEEVPGGWWVAPFPILRHMHDECAWDKVKEYLQAAASGLGLTAAAGSWAGGTPPGPNLPRKDVGDEIDAHKQAPAPHCELPWTQPLTDTVALAKQWWSQKQ